MSKAEAKTENLPAHKISEQASVVDISQPEAIDLSKFKVKRVITRPVLKLEVGRPVAFRVTEKMHEGKEIAGGKEGMKPATLMYVENILDGGRPMQIVVPAVLESELNDSYPNNGYVGCYFGVEKLEKVEGKRYHNYNIVELSADQFSGAK